MRWDVVGWAAVALLLFAAEAMAPGAFMLWMGFAAAVVFVGVLLNGLTMLNAPYYMQDFIKGVLLVLALAFTFGIGRRADARA